MMRLLLITAALGFIPGASAAAPEHVVRPAAPAPHPAAAEQAVISAYGHRCPAVTARIAKALKQGPKFHKLTDLPDANAYSAVFRSGPDGCPDPIVIDYNVGKTGR